MKVVILTKDKQSDGSYIRTLIEIDQTEETHTGIPWDAQAMSQDSLDLLASAIAKRLGVEPQPIDLIEITSEIAAEREIEFRRLEVKP